MNQVIDLQIWQMLAAYIFVLIVMLIVKLKGIPREKELIISSVRMTIQLILTGYLLIYLFDTSSPLYTILVLIGMEVFSVHNIIKRTKQKLFHTNCGNADRQFHDGHLYRRQPIDRGHGIAEK